MKNFNLALLLALLVVTTSASAQVAYVLRTSSSVGTEGHYLPAFGSSCTLLPDVSVYPY